MIIFFNDVFYVGIYLCFILFIYCFDMLTCFDIFYHRYITVYVRVDVIDRPLKITQ